MMVQRIRAANSLLVIGDQPDETVFPALDPATDAIFAEGTAVDPNVDTAEINEDTGSLDRGERRVVSVIEQIRSKIYLVGANAAGTAPKWGRLMPALGWAEVITASAIPAAPEAVGAGSSTTQVVLGASASSVDQIYRGMPLHLTGDMDIVTFIADYDGVTKTATVTDTLPSAPAAATTTWQILPNVLYRPASTGLPVLAAEVYLDGVRVRVDGIRGNGVLNFATRGVGSIDLTLQGRHVDEADAPPPAVTDDRPVKPVFRAGVALLDRRPIAIASASLDPQLSVELPDDPNTPMGHGVAEAGGRQMQVTLDPEMRLIADGGDVMGDLLSGREMIAHLRYGSIAGNRIALTVPRAAIAEAGRGTRGSFRTRELNLDARGADAGAFLCVW